MDPLRIINPENSPPNPALEAAEEDFVTELTAHQSALQAFVQSLMPGDSSVDDVVQRTNITLWRKRDSFTPGTNFRAWAFEVAKWNVRSHFKEMGRKHWLVFDEELTTAIAGQMEEKLQIHPSERRIALLECMARMRETDRDLLLSHYEKGESLAEFAARTHRSPNGIKVTLFRLRTALRRCISARMALETRHSKKP